MISEQPNLSELQQKQDLRTLGTYRGNHRGIAPTNPIYRGSA